MRVLFVGTAAGRRSAALGAYYAHPGNRFWQTLFDIGLTESVQASAEFARLLESGIGFTDLAKTVSGMDHEIQLSAYDIGDFKRRVAGVRPAIVAFTSKKAGSLALGLPTGQLGYGRQSPGLDDVTATFVLLSTSGAAARSWSSAPWFDLAAAVNRL